MDAEICLEQRVDRSDRMDIEIRPMQRRDVLAVHKIECTCFRSPWSKASLFGELRNDVAHYRVVEREDGSLLGYAGMWVLFEEAHVTNVAILPEFRRNGYARRLMLAMMECAAAHGATAMTLEVRRSNLAAQSLYQGLDFLQNGCRPRYYSDTGEDAILMWNMDMQRTLKNNGGN